MKTEPKTKFTKDIISKALSLLLTLTDSLPVLILYIFTVLWYTVLNRAETYDIPQRELFWSFRKFLSGNPRIGIEIVANVIMFMPFGFLLCDLFCRWTPTRITRPSAPSSSSASNVQAYRNSGGSRLNRYGKWLLIPLLALSFSLLIESLQMTLVRGLAEPDDLFTNTLGAVLGICSYEILQKLSEARFLENVLAVIQKNPIRKNPIQRNSIRENPLSGTVSRAGHCFKTLNSVIRAAFALICLAILIFDRKIYPFEENNLTRSFCFQVDEASIQGNEMTLRGFAFGYNRRHIEPRLILRQTKTIDQTDINVSLRQAKNEGHTNMDVDLLQATTDDQINTDVNLRQTKTGDSIVLDVNYGSARPDVNKYFLCDYDYTDVGFTATGNVNPEIEYEIMIGWPLTKLVSTGVYILGEDVHRVAYEETYNEKMIETEKEKAQVRTTEKEHSNSTDGKESPNRPSEKERLSNTDVEEENTIETTEKERPGNTDSKESLDKTSEKEHHRSSDEEKITLGTFKEENLSGTGGFKMPTLTTDFVKKGTLLVCRPDMHIWIFQYDGSLYWVADERFHFEDDSLTYIQYHLWTTQLEKLPPGRLAKNYFWNNLSGYFEKYELSGDFGKYRVMRCELPTEYSITSILTGYRKDGTWVWANSFRPVYTF